MREARGVLEGSGVLISWLEGERLQRLFAYEDRGNNEKSQFVDAFGTRMRARMQYLVKWDALQAC